MAVTRLLQYKTKMSDRAVDIQATPWIPTGRLTVSAVIKATPGYFGGIIIQNPESETTQTIKVWDSETATTTGDNEVCFITCGPAADDKWVAPLEPGVECENGIYVELEEQSSLEYLVYYK